MLLQQTSPAIGQSEQLPLDDVTIVHIACARGVSASKTDPELTVFPKRVGDSLIFKTGESQRGAPEKPRQALWHVTGLGEGEKVRIEAKIAGSGILPSDFYEIVFPNNAVRSGVAQRGPTGGADVQWPYSVIWFDRNGQELKRIDPVIVIKNDP